MKPNEQAKSFQGYAHPLETTPAMLASNQYTRVWWCLALKKKTPAWCRRNYPHKTDGHTDMDSLPEFVVDDQQPIEKNGASLDLFSIRHKSAVSFGTYAPPQEPVKCINRAPFFAWKTSEKGYAIAQGNCHDWKCPKCGINRAKREYGRIVEGCSTLAEQFDLYFVTLTCRGREMSLEQSEAGYYSWTNRLLNALRENAKVKSVHWAYVQVTERQKRGHPHSHLLTTYHPHDLRLGTKESWQTIDGRLVKQEIECLRSDWLEKRCISAGLGKQYDISKVRSAEAASRYVAKYMFKPSMFVTNWPKKWRRVRYSRSFPKLPEIETDALLLLKREDWRKLARLAVVVNPQDKTAQSEAEYWFANADVIIRKASS